ncbi:hypothetical protein KQI52_10480 [bacterium]|nr:hypothetical protein [bacterium]
MRIRARHVVPGTDAMGHRVRIHASEFLPVDNGMIPTGERLSVAETPFDFRTLRTLGERIGEDYPQLAIGKRYDHVVAAANGQVAGHFERNEEK